MKVAGYVSLLQPGKSARAARRAFTRTAKGEYAITVEIKDRSQAGSWERIRSARTPGCPAAGRNGFSRRR